MVSPLQYLKLPTKTIRNPWPLVQSRDWINRPVTPQAFQHAVWLRHIYWLRAGGKLSDVQHKPLVHTQYFYNSQSR
jgi:hypothetical protein